MESVEVRRTIHAPPEAVWRVLTNTEALASGPFGITRLDGDISLGGKLALWTEVSPKRAFKLRVAELDPPNTMAWHGGMPLGLFRGVRTFALEPCAEGTSFHMREEFSGPLLGLIWKSMPDLGPSFQQFAAALADAAEASA